MHGHGNYAAQVGQGTHVPPPAFQQHPGAVAATTFPSMPPTFHPAPPGSQLPGTRSGHHTFPLPPRSISFTHTLPGAPHQGPIAPVVSNGTNSGQSYLTHLPAPLAHGSAQTVNSYPTFEPRPFPWSQNIRQINPLAPLPVPRAYLPPSSQCYAMERGPPPQAPSQHVPPPLLPSNSSTSGFSMTDSFASSARSMPQRSYLHSVESLPPLPLPPPPPPPQPPLPPFPPPGVPPLSSSSPPNVSKNSESHKLKAFPHEDDLISKHHTPHPKPAEDRTSLDVEVMHRPTEISPAAETTDATFTHSPSDSDMDMEDDITLPDEEKHSCASKNLNGGCASLSQDVVMKDQLEASLGTEGQRSPKVALDGNSLNAESSGSQVQRLGANGVELSDRLTGGANSFKLLLGYASDDSLENDAKTSIGDVSIPSIKFGSTDFDADKGCNIMSELKSNEKLPLKFMIESFSPGKADEFSDTSLGNLESVKVGNFGDPQAKDSSRSSNFGVSHQGGSFQKPDMKSKDTQLNVDEFGRLVREGVSDSDTSDSLQYGRGHARRSRKQSRSRSRSRSPRGRRRSPFRRNEGRYRSLSPSPKRQRSRSKSRGDRLRRNKGQFPECFDFVRGKCYRGATCRYSHHESDRSERSRHSRGKQQYHDTPPTFRSPDCLTEKNSEKKSVPGNKEVKDKGLKLLQDVSGVEEVKSLKALDPIASVSDKLNYLQSTSPLVADVVTRNLSNYSSFDVALGNNGSPQLVGPQNKQLGDFSIDESSTVQASATISTHLPASKLDAEEDSVSKLGSVGSSKMETYSADKIPSQSMNLNVSSPSIAKHRYQLPLPLPSVSQVMGAQFGQGIPQDYSLMPSTLINSKTENYSPDKAPVSNQRSLIPEPSNSSSSSFHPAPQPPQPPQQPHTHVTSNATVGDRGILSQQNMQQSLQPPQNGLYSYTSTRPYFSELLTPPQTGQYSSARETDQKPHISDEIRSSSFLVGNLMNNEGVRHILREETGHSVQGMAPSVSVTFSQPKSLMNPFLVGSLSSIGNPSHSHPYLQRDYYGMSNPVSHGVSSLLGEPGNVNSSISRIASDFLERNHPSRVADCVGSRISNHYNPYASTFDHPPNSQFKSNTLIPENDSPFNSKYGPPFRLSSEPAHEHKNGSVNLTNMMSSSTSAREAEGNFNRVASEQYDPLFDSIEPALNSFGSADHQKHDITDDSYVFPRFKMEGVVSSEYSPAIEEYGETADAEVGALVNGSPGNPHNTNEMNAGEIEIDQVKESGKNKKGKDSRSMKLFKISIATFVKEVLKPSWRQGNMSKEAFKTIVKKTVDKVSSAMKSHKIPKSQAKINHYIDSSRGKLIKLVMGYVDKYVKA